MLINNFCIYFTKTHQKIQRPLKCGRRVAADPLLGPRMTPDNTLRVNVNAATVAFTFALLNLLPLKDHVTQKLQFGKTPRAVPNRKDLRNKRNVLER